MDPSASSAKPANSLRDIPSVDVLLRLMDGAVAQWGRREVTAAIRIEIDTLRSELRAGGRCEEPTGHLRNLVEQRLLERQRSSLVAVINLTGTVLHTNLGRAVLPQSALDAVQRCAAAPSNLEYDLDAGERGERDSHVESILCDLTGAQAATVVNNNAAAVLLVLNTLARDREVPVSRGELVEIGGSFRIPEIMERSGARLVEVGATNRTHARDYERAIGAATALLMKVHASNYRIEGFTHAVDEKVLADLAHANDLPVVVDLGSGNLVDYRALGLPAEPTVASIVAKGIDVLTFSGDKLLGGPQCGIIVGRRDLLEQIRSNPLKRALRPDKMTLAALDAVLRLYLDPDTLAENLPTLRYLSRPEESIHEQALRLAPQLAAVLGPQYEVSYEPCQSQIGSGALPVASLASHALIIRARDDVDAPLRRLAEAFRHLQRPVLGRLRDGALLLDLRCLDCEALFVAQLKPLGDMLA